MEDQSYPFPTYSGLIKAEHRERMGTAIWEFLWCIDKTTTEYIRDGELLGVVLGGKPVKAEEIGADLGEHHETVKKNLRRLQKAGYIHLTRTPYGNIIEVRKSKKFSFFKRQSENALSKDNRQSGMTLSEENRQSENTLSGQSENALSHERQSQNALSGQSEITLSETRQSENASSRQSENALSNKTLQLDIIDAAEGRMDRYKALQSSTLGAEGWIDRGAVPQGESDGMPFTGGAVPQQISQSPIYRIERHLADKMQVLHISTADFQTIQKLLKKGITEQEIIQGIDESFAKYVPKFDGDRIRSINYCVPLIEQIHQSNLERERAEAEVVAGVLTPSHQSTRTGYVRTQKPKVKSEYLEKLRKAGLK